MNNDLFNWFMSQDNIRKEIIVECFVSKNMELFNEYLAEQKEFYSNPLPF